MTQAPQGEQAVRFVPRKYRGMADVTEVAVFPDRLEVRTGGGWKVFRYHDIARRQQPLLRELFRRLLGRPVGRRVPGGRDFGHLVFYTEPELRLWTPEGDEGREYAEGIRWKVCEVVRAGGYLMWDLT